jgi:CHAD domain-containing protein
MSHTISLSAVSGDRGIGLEIWMQRVIERAERARDDWDKDSVHDLRVALRRCRTMAEALSQVNPDSGWRKIRKSSRDLFRVLGDLRDTQVERLSVKKLAAPGERLRVHLLRMLSERERLQRDAARRALGDFSLKEWKRLSRRLARKARLFPLESIVFQRLALSKLQESSDLFIRARKARSGAAWHRARIGLKHFRYIAENFLPRKYAPWTADVKRLQDLLGEVHDFDVLRADVRRNSAGIDPAIVADWLERIQSQRKVRLASVATMSFGSASVLQVWRSGLEIAHPLTLAPALDHRRSA